MSILISGSIAFDNILAFEGCFTDHILPDQIGKLSVSFLTPQMRSNFGGCAGNIAYAVKLLGAVPLPLASVGKDGANYLKHLRQLGIDTRFIATLDDCYTAQCTIVTDGKQNQITAFHPGAMNESHRNPVPTQEAIALAIVSPNGKLAMQTHAAQLHEAGIAFVFDPGQGIPLFNGAELQQIIDQASWLVVNDYEAFLVCEKLGCSRADLSQKVRGMVVTLGENGCEVWLNGCCHTINAVQPTEVADPTGCGDAWRGALLYGLQQGWDLVRCARLGNYMGSIKVAHHGPQNYHINLADVAGY